MSEEVAIGEFTNLQGSKVTLFQHGSAYVVAKSDDLKLLQQECKHDKGFKALPVEPDLYAYVCNCGCGFKSASNPDDPSAVRFVRHVPSPEDKAVRLSKGGEN